MTPEQRLVALVTEFDRIKARLDLMDRQIQGDHDAWWQITTNLPETVAEVNVRPVLAEARMYASALASLAKSIVALSGGEVRSTTGDPLDEIAKKRQEKLQGLSG